MVNAKLCLLVTAGLLAGCAAQPDKDRTATVANANGDGRQCQSEPITGSMLHKTVCSTQAQRDAERQAAQDLKDTTGRQGGACKAGATVC
jgi:hypothetical protein